MQDYAHEIIDICRRLNQKGMLAAADGNVSFRRSSQEIVITPSGRNKAFISEKDLARITLENEVLSGIPSGERLMHLEIYRRVPEAKWIVHAHPPTAIGWTVAFPELTELPNRSLSEIILAVGKVPIAPYARPGTHEMGAVLASYLPESRVILLSRHGAVSWGETAEEAYGGIERVEAIALILKAAKELGGDALSELPEAEVEFLQKLRQQMGNRTL